MIIDNLQVSVYAREVRDLLERMEAGAGAHLAAISKLKKICSSPYLLEKLDMTGLFKCIYLIYNYAYSKYILVQLQISTLSSALQNKPGIREKSFQ